MKKNSIIYIILLLVAIAVIANVLIANMPLEYVEVTVTGKERIVEGSGEDITSKYLVFTDSEVFQNTDEMAKSKYNSSDIQGRIKENRTYRFGVIGRRIPQLSMYRNIITVEEIETATSF
jgi:hypothetical protein